MIFQNNSFINKIAYSHWCLGRGFGANGGPAIQGAATRRAANQGATIREAAMERSERQFRGGDGVEGPAIRGAAAFRGSVIRRVAMGGAAMERRKW